MVRDFTRVVCGVVLASSMGGWLLLMGLPARAQDPFGDSAAETQQAVEGEDLRDDPFGGSAEAKQPSALVRAAQEFLQKHAKPPQPNEQAHPLPVAGSKPEDTLTAEREAKIRHTLLQPTKMEFVEMPLQDAITYLKDYHGIEIQLDDRALNEAGVGSDTPMSRTLNDLSLAAALRILLDDIDLTYVIRDGVLFITTKEKAATLLELRVYNVDELVGHEATAEKVAGLLGTLSGAGQGSCKTSIANLQIVPFDELLIVRASQQDHDSVEALLRQIKEKLGSQ